MALTYGLVLYFIIPFRNPEPQVIVSKLIPGKDGTYGASKPPSLPLKAYSGSYSNPGYGVLKLCSPSCATKDCKVVLAEFSAVEKYSSCPNTKAQQLVGRWARLWTTHLRVVHVNGDIFSFRPASLFPNGYGGNNTPFEINFDFLEGDMSSYAEVEFVVKENEVVGFGIFGYVPGDVKLRKGGSVEEDALVYFSRTSDCCCRF